MGNHFLEYQFRVAQRRLEVLVDMFGLHDPRVHALNRVVDRLALKLQRQKMKVAL